MVSLRQRQRKGVFGDGCDLAVEDLDLDDGWLSWITLMKMMVAAMPVVEFGQPKWVHYTPVKIPSGSGVNYDGVGVI